MIDSTDLTPDLIGALVRYDGGIAPEYGLVQSWNETGTLVWVRFGHGDTAMSAARGSLTVVVPALRPQDRPESPPKVVEWPLSMDEVHEITGYLLGLGTRDGIIHGDTLNAAMGASARRRAGVVDAPPYQQAGT